MTSATAAIFEARGVCKRYGGVHALDDVSLSVRPGEVLAVVGENGAGKSTLMKVLAGVVQPSRGSVLVDGRPTVFAHIHQALSAGVALIHQELNLAPNLDLGANVFLGREPRRLGFISKKAIADQARQHMARVGLEVSPEVRLDSLSLGQQQLVEIAKALSVDARVLIMDEPTSSLSQQEADKLYKVVRQLRERGIAICYISHRLHEVTDLADRVVVLRDGRSVGELSGAQIDRDKIVRMMVGRDISQYYQRTPLAAGGVAITARSLRTSAFPSEELDFSVRSGEIVGLAGLVGAGRTELLTTLFGITPMLGGSLHVDGKPYAPQTAAEAIAAGVVLAPEDRRQCGLLLQKGVRWNLSLASLRKTLSRWGFVRPRAEGKLCTDTIEQLRIKTPDRESPVHTLSGGNQQKVVLGKWLATKPRVLLLDEPTRGIDVGSKSEIYALMHELAGRGVAVLFASSDMEEILGLSDRALVMHHGRITGEVHRDQLSEESVMQLAVAET
ncbi:MAG: sugar ABC transporter ATP-binding protein [Pirellulales bacterium]|nr:sugar ABC transporter ATP-binding protein [Pirellulales bacterium]